MKENYNKLYILELQKKDMDESPFFNCFNNLLMTTSIDMYSYLFKKEYGKFKYENFLELLLEASENKKLKKSKFTLYQEKNNQVLEYKVDNYWISKRDAEEIIEELKNASIFA